jgi:hypothetical protein
MISFEKEVCSYLNIPSLPKKEWDGKSSFKNAVATIKLGGSRLAYAVASYDEAKDNAPRVVKSFMTEPFYGIDKVFVVPSYMETDVDNMDLDEQSKKAAEDLKKEAEELENQGAEETTEVPENEYCFDHIHNDEEAIAFIEAYNRENNIKGAIPKKHESIIARLTVIYAESLKKAPKAKEDVVDAAPEAEKTEE